MRLTPPSLLQHLNKSLANLYLLFGNEHFLVEESCKAIRARIHQLGEVEHHILNDASSEQVNTLIEQRSLFANAKIIEIKINKFNPALISTLQALCETPLTDCYIIIQAQMLTRAQQQAKWFTMVEQIGIVVAHWPLTGAQFSQWVDEQASQKGVTLTPELRMRLLSYTEGNALAAAQEIDRLRLTGTEIYFESMSKFELFELIDAALSRQPARVIKIVSYLKNSKEALQLVIWSLGQTIRALNRCANASPARHTSTLSQAGIRTQSHPLYLRALKDTPNTHWVSLLAYLFCADKQLKSGNETSAWQTVLDLSLRLANSPVF